MTPAPKPSAKARKEPELIPADYTKSCDWCAAQDGRHYCLLHTIQIKNMDTVACKDWRDREEPNK